MPRSSRHKSSKHSSKDVKEYSESGKDSTSRDRRSREEVSARVSKDLSSVDKRKLDLKDAKESYGTGNGEHLEEYGSSKRRRREKGDDGTADRWNGSGDHDRGDNVVVVGNGEVGNKSAGKEGRHRESRRKEAREGGAERENKGRHERVADTEDHRLAKQVVENTGSVVEDMLLSSRSESQIDGGIRKRRDGNGDGNKERGGSGNVNERSSKDNSGKDSRQKSEKLKDDKHKEKYRDDFEKESKHQDNKQKDKHSVKGHVGSWFDEKRPKDGKDVEIQNKKSKTRDGDQDRDRNGSRDWDLDSIRDREADRRPYRDREDERKRGGDQSRDHDYDQDSDRDRDRVRERNREREHIDYDRSYIDDRSGKYRSSREKKRSPDDYDDYADAKATSVRAHRFDPEKKSTRIDRVEAINLESEDTKYRDSMQEQSSKANYSRDLSGSSGLMEKGSKYRSVEKLAKSNDGCFIESFNERSSSSKASPLGLVDRSPSSTNDDRRHLSRTGVRRSLDVEETGRRRSASVDMRELSTVEERGTLNLPLQKPMIDESSQVDSSFCRVTQGGSSLFVPPAFRSGVGSPSFTNSVEDNSRASSSGRYRRNNDPNAGRMHGNAWRGVSNWTAPMPSSFIPFQHGLPHGGFQSMVPQFPAPPLFVRPLEINHTGMPYHISDMERFSSPFRPLGWQNVIDASLPSNLNGWDGSNGGVFRDEQLVYRGAEWDQNGFMKNGGGWESSALWKGQNGDGKTDSASPSDKDDHGLHAHGDSIAGGPINEMSHPEHSPRGVLLKSTDSTSNVVTPVKESSVHLPEPESGKSLSPKASRKNSSFLSHIYLSKIEVSATLAYPELYNQCVSLLESEGCLIEDDHTSNHKLIKIGARAGLGSSKIIQSPSPFPPAKDFVYKKAMDIYKKQMMKERDVVFRSEETTDMKYPSSAKIAGDQAATNVENGKEDPVAAVDVEMTEPTDLKLENSDGDNRILNESVQEVEDNGKLNLSSEEIERMAVQQVDVKPEGYGNEPPSQAEDMLIDTPYILRDEPTDDRLINTPSSLPDKSVDDKLIDTPSSLPDMAADYKLVDTPSSLPDKPADDKLVDTPSSLPDKPAHDKLIDTPSSLPDKAADYKLVDTLYSLPDKPADDKLIDTPSSLPDKPAHDKLIETPSSLPDKPSNDSDSTKGLCFGDDEFKGLMPIDGSNESGSVVKSRIHDHSPESTH